VKRFASFQAVLGTDSLSDTQLVMIFALDKLGELWVKKNALDKDCEWERVDEHPLDRRETSDSR